MTPTHEQLQAAERLRKWKTEDYASEDERRSFKYYHPDQDRPILADYALAVIAAGDETAKLRELLQDASDVLFNWLGAYSALDDDQLLACRNQAREMRQEIETALARTPGGEQ